MDGVPEEHQEHDENDEVASPFQKVFGNCSIASEILAYLPAPEDSVHLKQTCKLFKLAVDNFQDEFTTLTIIANDNRHIDIKFGEKSFSFYSGNGCLFRNELELVKEKLDNDINLIKKIVAKGVRISPQDRARLGYRLYFDDGLTDFLDSLPALVHLEFETVSFTQVANGFQNAEFVQKIRRLHLIDIRDFHERLSQLIGPKVQHLHFSEMMLRNQQNLIKWLSKKNIHVIIYMDDEKYLYSFIRDGDRFLYIRNGVPIDLTFHVKEIDKYVQIIYHKGLHKEVRIGGDTLQSIKHCQDLRKLVLVKSPENGHHSEILRLILEILYCPKLTKIVIDGNYTPHEYQKLSIVLSESSNLTHLCMKVKPHEMNGRRWLIWRNRVPRRFKIIQKARIKFIETLPSSVVCVKLDDVLTSDIIHALKRSKGSTLSKLYIRQRDVQLSNNSLKLICRYFRNLDYLKLNGFRPSMRRFRILRNCSIQKIECHCDHSAFNFLHDARMLYRNVKEFSWDMSGDKVVITISEMDMTF